MTFDRMEDYLHSFAATAMGFAYTVGVLLVFLMFRLEARYFSPGGGLFLFRISHYSEVFFACRRAFSNQGFALRRGTFRLSARRFSLLVQRKGSKRKDSPAVLV